VRALGLALVLVGGALAARSALLLAGRGRPRRGPRPAFVLAGPYLRHRNPLYAGLLVALVGAVLLARAPLALAGVAVAALAVHLAVVRLEEPRLRRRFGATYAAYCARVPRWVPRRPPRDRAI